MSKYDELKWKAKLASEYNNIMFEREVGLNKRLKEDDYQRHCDRLYSLGRQWILTQEKLLDEATDTYTYDGKETMYRDDIHFQRGYEAGCKQKGYETGYRGVSFVTIDDALLTDKYFLEGYKKGLQDVEKDRNKSHTENKR